MKRIKSMYKFAKGPIKDYVKSGEFRRGVRYSNELNKPVYEDVILYESFHGKGLSDSPFAMFKYMLNDIKYRDFKHVWAVTQKEEKMLRGYEKYSNVEFVIVHSREYIRYLARAKYLINNTSFSPYFMKRKEQTYINTWHGTPLKHLGKDVKTAVKSYSCNLVRNFIASDYLIHQNRYTTEIFNRTYDLQDIYPGKIIDVRHVAV